MAYDTIDRGDINWNHYDKDREEPYGTDIYTLTDADMERLKAGEKLILPIQLGEHILILKGPGHADGT